MRKCLCLLTLVCVFPAKADSVGIDIYTAHWNSGLNNVNPGVYYQFNNGVTLGAYQNSFHKPSAFVGYTVRFTLVDVLFGVASGYNGVCPKICKTLTPMVVPSLKLPIYNEYSMRLSIPNAQGVHLSVEKEF